MVGEVPLKTPGRGSSHSKAHHRSRTVSSDPEPPKTSLGKRVVRLELEAMD